MTLLQAACALILGGVLAGAAQADEPAALLQAGSYEVTYRLELPHVESWAIDKTRTICVADAGAARLAPLPVLSGNNPLATCPAENIRRDGATLRFDIVCAGRNAARARAAYTLGRSEFRTALEVTLPLARNGILAGLVLAFARALGEFGATLMLAGNIPGKTATVPLAIYTAVQVGETQEALLLVGVLTALSCAVLLVSSRLGARAT